MADKDRIDALESKIEILEGMVVKLFEDHAENASDVNETMLNIASFIRQREREGVATKRSDVRRASGMNAPIWASDRVAMRNLKAAIDAGYINDDGGVLSTNLGEEPF